MKALFIILGTLILSACSTDQNEETLLYSFNTVEYGHTNDAEHAVEMNLEEEGQIFTREEIANLDLHLEVINHTGATIEVGNHLEIEKFDDRAWEMLEASEDSTEDAVLISIPTERSSEYVISVSDRFLEYYDLIGGTYRLNNNDAFYTYLTITEFQSR